MYRRTIITLIAVTTAALLAVAFTPPAEAAHPTTAQLLKQRAHAWQLLARAKERSAHAAAALAAALALQAGAGSAGGAVPTPLATPPSDLEADLAARLLDDGVVSDEEIAALRRQAEERRRSVRRWERKVERLNARIHRRRQIDRWARSHRWRPLIEIAGHKYGVDPGGLYRMMMLESGGSPTAGTTFKGLFQYLPSTWAGRWNPWRRESIHDGWAQIRATALALSKGMGPSQWPNTYPMAF